MPINAPHLLAGLGVQSHQKRLLFIIVYDVKLAFVQHGRGCQAPTITRLVGGPFLFPDLFALHRVTIETLIPEVGVNTFPIGDRCFGGVTILDMYTALGNSRVRGLFPNQLSGIQIQAHDLPMMPAHRRLVAFTAKVQPFFGFPCLALGHNSREKNLIAPNNG